MDLGLAGRVAIVAASSKGLGRASADALAAECASLVVSARGREGLEAAVSALEESGASVVGVRCDVTAPGAAEQLVDAALSRFGRLGVVVANAGGPPAGT